MNNNKKAIGNLLVSNRHLMLILVIGIIGVVFQSLTRGMFLSARNLGTLFLQFSTLGYLTVGVVFVIITRGIDLSIASVIGLVAATGAVLNILHGVAPLPVMLVMLALCLLIGCVYGGIVAYVGVPAFVVTLAGQMSLKGAALLVSNGQERAPLDERISAIATTWLAPSISAIVIAAVVVLFIISTISGFNKARKEDPSMKLSTQFLRLLPVIAVALLLFYVSSFKGLPLMFIILVIWASIAHIVLGFTSFGRSVYAVGANPEAARLNGIDPRKIILKCFMVMSVAYFLGTVGSMSRITGYSPTIATGIEMDAVAAAVIGGTSLQGGYGTAFGAVLGAILLTAIDNGMILMNVTTFWQYVVKGLILLLAVILDVRSKRK